MSTMTATEARAAMPDLLDRVAAGEEVTITRHGRPVAVVVRPDALRVRRADQALGAAARIRDVLAAARGARLSTAGGMGEVRADALVAELRAVRAGR
jgi:antitoxin (DNA-binding transcriptional repressor) of toxin-antitoxin stability system